MLKISSNKDYYPTPESLLEKITEGIKWLEIGYILEPSAGKGNICEFVRKKNHRIEIDCIEIEPELRSILKDKKFRVIHDDFLTLHTYKHYDLIIMNPPFSEGARHLLKAIEVQSRTGGGVLCILNAETIRNPYTNERKELEQKLQEYNAEIKYYENAFSSAENPSDVEIAVVKFMIPAPERKTTIFETLREKEYQEYERKREYGEITEADFIKSFIAFYNLELEWGLKLYDEFLELKNRVLDNEARLSIEIASEYRVKDNFSVNGYVREVRAKYWDKLFKHPEFTGKLTSNLSNKYLSQVNEFSNYDFSYFNIKTVQIEVAKTLVQGVEDCILSLFDELSYKHSWRKEIDNGNIHYYNGWKSNESWRINKRVIMPFYFHEKRSYGYYFDYLRAVSKLADIEKALNYLDNEETDSHIDIAYKLQEARDTNNFSNIHLKYFDVTFYKKGTCHITFTNERLLKKLNIFGSQKKGWLPHGYGRRNYSEMDAEEQAVIDSFEGQAAYQETVNESKYYLFDINSSLPMLGA